MAKMVEKTNIDALLAVYESDIVQVKRYIEENNDIKKVRDKLGNSTLHFAKNIAIIKILLKEGIDVNDQNSDLETPLHTLHKYYSSNGGALLDIGRLLLGEGASPNIQDKNGYNALHVLYLYSGKYGTSITSDAVKEFTQLLLKHKVDVNAPDYEGRTPLFYAIHENDIDMVKSLIEAGSNSNHRDISGCTPLSQLIDSDNFDMLKTLLDNGTDPCISDIDGRTPLYLAVAVGNFTMVKLIIDANKASINVSDKNKITVLHVASAYKRTDIVELLLKYGASPNAKDVLNACPLHYAAYGGTPEILSFLLRAGANRNEKDISGNIPEHYALSRHYYCTLKAFGKDRLAEALNIPADAMPEVEDKNMLKHLPVDDVFNIVLPYSKIKKDPFDTSVFPDGLLQYVNTVANGDMNQYLNDMLNIPGIGLLPDTEEINEIKENVEAFAKRWTDAIARIDERFQGTLIPSGSVYEWTKIEDPCEFDFMFCFDRFKGNFIVKTLDCTEFNDVKIIQKQQPFGNTNFDDLCVHNELKSEMVIRCFIIAARQALAAMKYESGSKKLYLENLTEETYIDDAWVDTNTVTCNLKFQWAGIHNKLLTISMDLVPALHVDNWPTIALSNSSLISEYIKEKGCYVVSKKCRWRLSFSLAEQAIFRNISEKDRRAFTGAKVILNAAVSAYITLYEDVVLDEDENSSVINDSAEFHSNTSQHYDEKDLEHYGEKDIEHYGGKDIEHYGGEDIEHYVEKGLQHYDEKGLQHYGEKEDEENSDSSDIHIYKFVPRDFIGTYLIKMTFFSVLEEMRNDESNSEGITTGHIFSKLFKCCKENKPLPYFFVPKHDMLSTIEDTNREKMGLALTMLHYLFENIPIQRYDEDEKNV